MLKKPYRQLKGMASKHYTPCVKYHVAVCFGAPGVLEHVWKFGSLWPPACRQSSWCSKECGLWLDEGPHLAGPEGFR